MGTDTFATHNAAEPKRVMLYFGSFNPIHNGHVALAEYVLQHTGTDEVWLVVSPHNPLKQRGDLWNDDLRFELANLAVHDNNRILVSDIEFSLPQPNYTVNTLRMLSIKYPDIHFSLLIGADNYEIFDKWYAYHEIIAKYRIYVYPREGVEADKKRFPEMQWIEAPLYPVSSTIIRDRLANHDSISDLVSPAVEQRILDVFQFGRQ